MSSSYSYNGEHSRFSHRSARSSFSTSGATFISISAWYASSHSRSFTLRSGTSTNFFPMGHCAYRNGVSIPDMPQGAGDETDHGDVLEAEVALVAKVIRGLCLAYDDDVFDPNAVFAVLVVARFYE